MEFCSLGCGREAELLVYPNYSTYNASGVDRTREPICGKCAAQLIEERQAERAGPFAIVRIK